MERKIFVVLAFVLLASAFTSCEYDDSGLWDKLNSLEQQVDANKEDIATLTSLVEALNKGKVIVSTTQTENGYTLTFSDGSSVSITNGEDGDSFFVSIVEQDGMVIITLADGRVIKLPVINYELRVLTFEDEDYKGTDAPELMVEVGGLQTKAQLLLQQEHAPEQGHGVRAAGHGADDGLPGGYHLVPSNGGKHFIQHASTPGRQRW